MEDLFEDMPSCLALESSGDSIMGQEEEDNMINSWLVEDTDVCDLLVGDAPLLDLQSVSGSPEYLCFGSQYSSPESPPSYTSTPELPELEGTLVTVDTPPLFGEQIDDAVLFSNSFTVNPDVLPELEKILASVECLSSPESSAPQSPATPAEVSDKRASKKRKGDDGKEIKGSDILLPRDQLLVMTSAEIETYVAGLKSQRNLTASEEKDLKRQRRLVKNREYASQSRSRKKQFVDELEKAMEALRTENTSLKQQVGTLTEENKTLKKKLSSIATTIKKSSSNSLTTSSSGVLTRLTSVGRPNASKTVGACLLAMMFMVISVGMLGDNQGKFLIYPTSQHADAHVYVGRVLLETTVAENEGVLPPILETVKHTKSARQPPPTTTTKTSTRHTAPTTTTKEPTSTTTEEEPTTTTTTITTQEPSTTATTTTTTLVWTSVAVKAETAAPVTSFSVGDKEVENMQICVAEKKNTPVLSYDWMSVKYNTTDFTYKAAIEGLPSCSASAVYVS